MKRQADAGLNSKTLMSTQSQTTADSIELPPKTGRTPPGEGCGFLNSQLSLCVCYFPVLICFIATVHFHS